MQNTHNQSSRAYLAGGRFDVERMLAEKHVRWTIYDIWGVRDPKRTEPLSKPPSADVAAGTDVQSAYGPPKA